MMELLLKEYVSLFYMGVFNKLKGKKENVWIG